MVETRREINLVPVHAEYRPEIDGLRALSIAVVIANHFHKDLLPNGHLGVDTFFVISGYVITLSLAGTSARGLGCFLLQFYTRRIKRLVPALISCALPTAIAVCLFSENPGNSLKTGAASLFGISNLYLLGSSADYFAPATEFNVFTHTWSLGVEEQFYLLFPLMLWWLWLRPPRRVTCLGIAVTIGGIGIASLSAFLAQQRAHPDSAFYLMPFRFWELGSGCLVALLPRARWIEASWAGPFTAVALVIMAVAFGLPSACSLPATLVVVACTAWILVFARSGGVVHRVLSARMSVTVGTISYSLYLWHWSVLSLSRWTVGVHWYTAPLQLLAMFGCAAASYRWIERPLRRATWVRDGRWTVGLGLASSGAAACVLLVLLYQAKGRLFLGMRVDERVEAVGDDAHLSRKRAEEVAARIAECNMTPHHLSGKAYRKQPVVDEAFVGRCLETGRGVGKFVIVGDSFAEVSTRSIAAIADSIGYDFVVLVGYACPYPIPLSQVEGAAEQRCREVDEGMLERAVIASLRPGDLVIVRLYLEKSQYLHYGVMGEPAVTAYDGALRHLASEIRMKGAALLLIGSNPTLSPGQANVLVPQWFNGLSRADASVVRPTDNRETRLYHQLDRHLRDNDRQLGFAYLSLREDLCDNNGACRTIDGDSPLYTDAAHLSPRAHEMVFGRLNEFLRTEAGVR